VVDKKVVFPSYRLVVALFSHSCNRSSRSEVLVFNVY
jgi:hypothetical protein